MEQAALASEEKKVEEEEKVDDPFTLGELEDEKRNFIVKYRPHKKVWNFIQEDPSERLPHLLRATADPNDAYIDERVRELLKVMEEMGMHLRTFNPEDWNHLNDATWQIFKAREDDLEKRMEIYI